MGYNPASRRKSYLRMRDKALAYSAKYNLERKFGLTQEAYNQLSEKQNGKCAVCFQVCSRKLAVDHDHRTGRIRGLLCNKCNRGIGYLQDDEGILQNALEYLRSNSGV